MASLFGNGDSASTTTISSPEELKRSVNQSVAQKKLKDLVEAMQNQCFQRCVFKPADSLSGTEQACIKGCVDKYWATFDVVASEWNKNVHKLNEKGGFMSR